MTQNAVCCEGCDTTDPTALIFMTNASWTAVRCAPCAVYLLTSLDRLDKATQIDAPEGNS